MTVTESKCPAKSPLLYHLFAEVIKRQYGGIDILTYVVIKMSGYIYNSTCKTALLSTAISGIAAQKVPVHNSGLHLIQRDATLSPIPFYVALVNHLLKLCEIA